MLMRISTTLSTGRLAMRATSRRLLTMVLLTMARSMVLTSSTLPTRCERKTQMLSLGLTACCQSSLPMC
ncbi:hypothetical protein FR483_n366R [Paramecium bursaria Chlorella virus FR483]|uniref:Uncharacterized protein n366R n=1 Tax=Paramecium bursaria Chlorella virus FR483 TaxID=399781 RepID=A7J770_PBCVF|nr:hypothetical protein FR483_n366R [Paramecium bursaria Chlorella virus FR483]ABT15651.1 hypothetical protein FR483_n366R [Paramecium bursaria Chlorella virus FR483]